MVGTGVPQTERVASILDTFALLKLREFGYNLHSLGKLAFSTKKDILEHVYVDVSQNPQYRAFTSQKGVTPCLATSTRLYSFGRDRMLLPFEQLMLQGHRRSFQIPESMRSSQIRELAGEGMALPCLGTVLWSIYLLKGLP